MSALRITGIPASTTPLQLSTALSVPLNSLSLAPTSALDPSTQTATITLPKPSSATRLHAALKKNPPPPEIMGKNPDINTDFLGLTVLASAGAAMDAVE